MACAGSGLSVCFPHLLLVHLPLLQPHSLQRLGIAFPADLCRCRGTGRRGWEGHPGTCSGAAWGWRRERCGGAGLGAGPLPSPRGGGGGRQLSGPRGADLGLPGAPPVPGPVSCRPPARSPARAGETDEWASRRLHPVITRRIKRPAPGARGSNGPGRLEMGTEGRTWED